MMYLINAIYFKGDWKDQFEANNTYKQLTKLGMDIAFGPNLADFSLMSKSHRNERDRHTSIYGDFRKSRC